MRRLSRDEIANIAAHLSAWQSPQAMQAAVTDTMNILGPGNLFNQAGFAFLRDAWIAAEFATLRNAEQVRLVSDEWPDFKLLIEGRIERFEAVEADDPARRRGEEHRREVAKAEADPVDRWIARVEQSPDWLIGACRKKAGKRYGARANLVIFLNLSEFGIRQSEVEASFQSATECVKSAFDAVWVLWKQKAYVVWP